MDDDVADTVHNKEKGIMHTLSMAGTKFIISFVNVIYIAATNASRRMPTQKKNKKR